MGLTDTVKKFLSKINVFSRLGKRLSEMLSGNDGYWSAMRWMTVTTANTIVITWAIISIKNSALAPIPESVVTMFAISVTGKWLQAKDESKVNMAIMANSQDSSENDKNTMEINQKSEVTGSGN